MTGQNALWSWIWKNLRKEVDGDHYLITRDLSDTLEVDHSTVVRVWLLERYQN